MQTTQDATLLQRATWVPSEWRLRASSATTSDWAFLVLGTSRMTQNQPSLGGPACWSKAQANKLILVGDLMLPLPCPCFSGVGQRHGPSTVHLRQQAKPDWYSAADAVATLVKSLTKLL